MPMYRYTIQMAHLSKKILRPDIESEITSQLVRVILRTGRAASRKLMRELLTETEHLMLAKRLAAILMLKEECSYYRIGRTLGLSTSTLKRLNQQLLGGDFPTIERLVHMRKEKERFWHSLEVMLRAGMPPRGRGRWSGVDKILARIGKN